MKKIFLFLALFGLIACSSFSQQGWVPIRYKPIFRDSVDFLKQFKINGVLVLPNATEFNILNGALANTAEINRLVGVDSLIQTQLHKRAFIWNPTFLGTAMKFNTDTVATQAYARLHGSGTGGSTDTTHLSIRINAKADTLNPMFAGYLRTRQGGFLDTLGSQRWIRAYIGPPGGAVWGGIAGTLSSQSDLRIALNAKSDTVNQTFTGTIVLPSTTSIGTVSSTELSYIDNVTSSIQTQLSGKFTNNISATDKVLGRVSSGAGTVEEITMTAAGRALIDDATAADQRTTIGLGNVTNESKATMFTSPTITGSPSISGYVPTSTSVNGHALSGNIAVTATDVSLGNVTNESKATMFTNAALTGTPTAPTAAVGTNTTQISTTAYTKTEINTVLADTIAAAGELGDYAFLKADVNTPGNAVDLEYLQSYIGGGGGGGGFEYLKGNVDQTGFPSAGDSVLTHTHFIGKRPVVIREGQIQQQHTDNTAQDGFKFNNTTGAITFRPVLSASEQLEIWATNTIYFTELTAEGGGGAAESTLLTGLLGGWQFNEVSGTTANDVLGVYNGNNPGATVNVAGQFGTAYSFDGSNDYVTMGTAAALRPTGALSLSFWVKTSSTTQSGLAGDYLGRTPYTYGYSVIMAADGTLDATLRFSDDTGIQLTSVGAVNNNALHNIILTWSGSAAYIYIDNVQADTDTPGAKTLWYHTLNEFRVGDRGEGDWPLNGVMDDIYLWDKVLSSQERIDLQTKTYPWN